MGEPRRWIAASARRAHEVRLTAGRRSPVENFRCLAAEGYQLLRVQPKCQCIPAPSAAAGDEDLWLEVDAAAFDIVAYMVAVFFGGEPSPLFASTFAPRAQAALGKANLLQRLRTTLPSAIPVAEGRDSRKSCG
jgi:hypothetical protein